MSSPLILITGASRGLGRELCQQLQARGWPLVITSRGALDPTDALLLRGDVVLSGVDVASAPSRAVLLAELQRRDLRLAGVIHNAGLLPRGPDSCSAATFAEVMATNTSGPLLLSRELAAGGVLADGAIVLSVSSELGKYKHLSTAYAALVSGAASIEALVSLPYLASDSLIVGGGYAPLYCLSKAALNRGTQLLAQELAGRASVAAVHPGWCATDMGGGRAPKTAVEGATSIIAALDGLWAGVVPSGAFVDENATPWER